MPPSPIAEHFQDRFGRPPAVIAAAPGRVEFIGNHTDYNGGLVMGAAIDRTIQVAVAPRDDGRFRLTTAERHSLVELRREAIQPQKGGNAWLNYPLGVLVELERAGLPTLGGLDLWVESDLPSGAGLSSSAALELATARALLTLGGHSLSLADTVRAARRAENNFVGVPCGILDQGVSAFGQAGHLVLIDCATEEFSTVPLPADAHFWVINSNEKHSLVDSFYSERFRECQAVLQELESYLGEREHLARITSLELAQVRDRLPERLARRARHVVEENERVQRCRQLLREAAPLSQIGPLLDASHQSSSQLFENSTDALDLLVELARGRPGVHGARLTGGGFGGAILILADSHFQAEDAEAIVEAYGQARPEAPRPTVFHVRAGAGARVLSGADSEV